MCKRGIVLLPLRGKQWCLMSFVMFKYCLHYVLSLRQYSIVYNLIPRDESIEAVSKWSISYRCGSVTVYICLTSCLHEYWHERSCYHNCLFPILSIAQL